MALFGRKKNTEEKPAEKKVGKARAPKVKAEPKAVKPARTNTSYGYANIITRPRITEKASIAVEVSNAYTFEVAQSASKHDVMRAIQEAYKVWPRKVTITNLHGKRRFVRGKMATGVSVKKATVFLNTGDKIEIAQ